MRVGYVRTANDKIEGVKVQEDLLVEQFGCEEIYLDHGVNGVAKGPILEHFADFARMLGDLEKGDQVVVKDITRFARDVPQSYTMIRMIFNAGCSVLLANNNKVIKDDQDLWSMSWGDSPAKKEAEAKEVPSSGIIAEPRHPEIANPAVMHRYRFKATHSAESVTCELVGIDLSKYVAIVPRISPSGAVPVHQIGLNAKATLAKSLRIEQLGGRYSIKTQSDGVAVNGFAMSVHPEATSLVVNFSYRRPKEGRTYTIHLDILAYLREGVELSEIDAKAWGQ